MSSAIATLLSRASTKAVTDPGPTDAELRTIFEAAVRAPDHGRLRPWRFYVVRGDARKRLSDLFAAGAARREPNAIEKEREKPLRAPLTVVLVAKITPGHKIPEIEQMLSTAAAGMNILNAVHALGYGAKWLTGGNCYDPEFKREFGLDPTDRMLGFIQIGTPIDKFSTERPDPDQFVVHWGV